MTQRDFNLTIGRILERERAAGAAWVRGTINNEYRFSALVFAEHAEQESFELNQSKISKLWIQRLSNRQTVFNFDRGPDVAAANIYVQEIVDFLCEGLSDLVFVAGRD